MQRIVGILLIVLGVLAFVVQGISYTTEEEVLDVGPLEVTKEERNTIPLPPVLGALALVGGSDSWHSEGESRESAEPEGFPGYRVRAIEIGVFPYTDEAMSALISP